MIRIKCGTCGTSQGYKTRSSGNLSLPAAEERRLVDRGVADYVTRPIIGNDSGTVPPSGGQKPPNQPVDTTDDELPENDSTGGEKANLDSAEISRLERMPKADLEQMAQDMGVDISGAKNNRERAELLAAAMTDEGDGIPPETEDEDIVR